MSRTEDYLDELLHSVSMDEEKEETGTGKKPSAEDDFLSAFEDEILSGEDSEDFLQEFERELDLGSSAASAQTAEQTVENDRASDDGQNRTAQEDSALDLDAILNNAKEKMQDAGTPEELYAEDNIMIDTMSDFPGEDVSAGGQGKDMMSVGEDGMAFSDSEFGLGMDMGQREPLSDMPELPEEFAMDEFDMDPLMEHQEETPEPAAEEADGRKKKKKGQKGENGTEDGQQEGFLKKLSRILFGEDEPEESEGAESASGEAGTTDALSSGSTENFDLLNELEGSSGNPAPAAQEKEKKEKKKKEKKEKKPKEKKPKKEKPKKEKKPKPPKEPDLTPPLPKVPVILTFVMTASLLLLVIVGTNLLGYSTSLSEAKSAYALGNYTEAYASVGGLEIKEADTSVYEKYRIMANVATEYGAYQSFMEAGVYDMALDSLIRAIGRCEKYREDAETYGCMDELEKLETKAVSALSSFGITEELALELYAYEEKEAYTIEVHSILVAAGLLTEE